MLTSDRDKSSERNKWINIVKCTKEGLGAENIEERKRAYIQ
jgi:hypothetical protein